MTVGRSGESPIRLTVSHGIWLEKFTLGWNLVGILILGVSAVRARSVALAGFGLDSVIEIGASLVVLWELAETAKTRQRQALRLIRAAFLTLAGYVTIQTVVVFATGYRPHSSILGMVWTAATVGVMLSLAAGKRRTGEALGNRVLITEGRVTTVDAYLAVAVLAGVALNTTLGWWWADPVAGLLIVCYAVKEGRCIQADLGSAVADAPG